MRFTATYHELEDYRRAYGSYRYLEDSSTNPSETVHFRMETYNFLTICMNKIIIVSDKDDPAAHDFTITVHQWRSIRLALLAYLSIYSRPPSAAQRSFYATVHAQYANLLSQFDNLALVVAVEEAMSLPA